MPLKLPRCLAAATAVTMMLAASACSNTDIVSPPAAEEVGETYATWTQTGDPDINAALDEYAADHDPLMITSTSDWEAWLADLPPELADLSLPYRPGFEESVMVIGTHDECGAEPRVLLLVDTTLEYNVWLDPDVECATPPGTSIHMTIVDFDEIHATSHEDISFGF